MTATETDALDAVRAFNADSSIHGIIMQLPLPGHIDADRIIAAVESNEPPCIDDLRTWCKAHFARLRVSSPAQAWQFLGADEMAQCALEDCDPALIDAFVPGAPCETMEAIHKADVRLA